MVVCNQHFLEAGVPSGEHKCCLAKPADAIKEGWNRDGTIWASGLYPVRNEATKQRFELPPILAANAVVQVLEAHLTVFICADLLYLYRCYKLVHPCSL